VAVAFVMINAEAGAESEILDAVKRMEYVREAYVSYGVYDLLVKLEADTTDRLKDSITSLRGLSRVRSTLTMPVKE
jgi:DNA-binding Lrp family transcriptional regulator